ncbi:MAG: hypothetical protein WC736_06850 [Gallionella sp.]|jgi:hypothetical protein
MDRVYFGTAKIQALRRVALDANLLANLGLSQNDTLCVYLDIERKEIVLKAPEKSKNEKASLFDKKVMTETINTSTHSGLTDS